MEPVPIACTLGPDERVDRAGEWRDFFRAHVTAVEATTSVARLKLDTSPDALGDAASLSRREKECCAFFDFAIDVNAEVPWLVVSVPAAAGEALSGFLDVLAAP